ncbi:DUF5518 domain-containing protein [Halorientalis pallida]|uniref:DUF5518 domain-containing protein n=1 Tax=Halorientalis pallida TaxID=2479928 RepID=A0A498KTR1_9EURY|nr:DUF5518 domain-containing protein [Halorientalis pallida]RXK46670.1 hypothetical protein EAF64_18520 [Halorientalis pallida]
MADDSTMNALIGGVVTIVLSFTGFSPILGGAVAGYLNQRDGVRVGTLAGLIALVPLILGLFFFGGVLGLFSIFGGRGAMMAGGIGLIITLFAFAFVSAIIVGLSALGGYVGEYLYTEDVL